MPTSVDEWLSDPLGVVDRVCTSVGANASPQDALVAAAQGLCDAFEGHWDEIPLLTSRKLFHPPCCE
eukprot:gene9261-1664_t